MKRTSTIFICQNCGAKTSQFFGKCSSCEAWNSIIEEKLFASESKKITKNSPRSKQKGTYRYELIASIQENPITRLSSGYMEFDRVLGGGLVPGSLVLIGGDPGIGKSTLLLQAANEIAQQHSVIYMTAEESASQVQRIHGPFVTDAEVDKVSSFLRNLGSPNYIFEITSEESDEEYKNENDKSLDPLFDQAVDLISREQKASTSFLQRHLQIGYNRAARIIDVMEAEKMISPASQTGKREVLINQKN